MNGGPEAVARQPRLSPGDVRVEIVRYICTRGSKAAPDALSHAKEESLLRLDDYASGSGAGHAELPQLTRLRRQIISRSIGDPSGYYQDVMKFKGLIEGLQRAVVADLRRKGIRTVSLVVKDALAKQYETLSDEIAG